MRFRAAAAKSIRILIGDFNFFNIFFENPIDLKAALSFILMLIKEKEVINMSIGTRIKDLRQDSKRTLREQSEILGVSLNSVYRWEHDLVAPRKAVIERMADFYGVSFDWIAHGRAVEENNHFGGGVYHDANPESQLLRMYRNLSSNSKYKILGYIERICVEDMDDDLCREI